MSNIGKDNTKNILNQKKNVEVTDNQIAPIKVNNLGDRIELNIEKKFLLEHSNYDVMKILMTILSPIFLNKNKTVIHKGSAKNIKNNLFPHIAFFIENKSRYTGGRYSIFHQALLLSQYTKVTVVTNEDPPFRNDFKDYYNDNFTIIKSTEYLLNENENYFDIIVGVPLFSGQFASSYSIKWNLPLYMVMFESPNFVREYRDGEDSMEEYWVEFKKSIIESYNKHLLQKILVPSYESMNYVSRWLDNKVRIDVIYPCVNTIEANKAEPFDINKSKTKYDIVYSARINGFKNPIPIIKKLPKEFATYHLIGHISDVFKREIKKLNKDGYTIIEYGNCSDKTKFEIITSCDCLIHPSEFEGFGMPPMEALYFNVPVVVYDLPVLKEIYSTTINYAKEGDVNDFVKVVKKVIEGVRSDKDLYRVNKITSMQRCANDLRDSFAIPNITAGMIVYNGDDYIEYAIKAIYNYVSEIIIVEGAVKGYAKKYRSTDKTLSIIKRLKKNDILNKIVLVQKNDFFDDKIEMQNEIAKRVTGEFYIKVDHDEIWKPETLTESILYMKNNPNVTVIKLPFIHFWTNFNLIAKDAGGKWSTKHPRVWRWNKSFKHVKSFNFFQNPDKDFQKVASPFYEEVTLDNVEPIFHFGYVRKLKQISNKIKYYKNRGIEKIAKDTFSKFKNKNDQTQPTQDVRSWAEDFEGELPEVIKSHPYSKLKDIRYE